VQNQIADRFQIRNGRYDPVDADVDQKQLADFPEETRLEQRSLGNHAGSE